MTRLLDTRDDVETDLALIEEGEMSEQDSSIETCCVCGQRDYTSRMTVVGYRRWAHFWHTPPAAESDRTP